MRHERLFHRPDATIASGRSCVDLDGARDDGRGRSWVDPRVAFRGGRVGGLLPAVGVALEGGCRVVQYRSKKNDTVIKRSEARELLMLCRQFNALLLINDDVALANYIGADGVHLGQEDSSLLDARNQLGGQGLERAGRQCGVIA